MYPLAQLRVALSRLILPWLSIPVPACVDGPDSSMSLARHIVEQGIRRLLVVSDRTVITLGLAAPMIDLLRQSGVNVQVFDGVQPDPDAQQVAQGVSALVGGRAQALLAVGGGSVIDCAKAINLCHANGRSPAELAGLWLYQRPRRAGLPLFAVPTTAGTGSEATMAAVVSDRAARVKRSIIHPYLLPQRVALDPGLTVALPPAVTAATGMDALTHAVEAYVSRLATPTTDAWALQAVALVSQHLVPAVEDGRNLAARQGMLQASHVAGLAFTRAGVGYVHAFAHQFGALYHLPHGLANAIALPNVLSFSRPLCEARLAALARMVGLTGSDADELSQAFIVWTRQLNQRLGIPEVVAALREQDFEQIIDMAFAEAHGTYGLPRYLDRGAAHALLRQWLPPSQA